MLYTIYYYLVFLCLASNNFVNGQYVGDYCSIQDTGATGDCVLITNCPKALSNLEVGIFPQTCGFQGTTPIVCCARASGSISTTTTTQKTTTSTTTRTTTRTTRAPFANRTPGQISKRKCVEYGKYVYTKRKPVVLLVDAPDTTKNECGFKIVPLVVGGTKALVKEFPHMAVIGFETSTGDVRWGCGGTIISEQYILTAAHCLYTPEFGSAKFVKVGITKLDDRPYMQTLNIADRIPHPGFKPPSHYNDIALLRLERPMTLTPYARPACLFTRDVLPTKGAIATGWGDTTFLGSSSADLLKVVLEFSTKTKCTNSYQNDQRRLAEGIKFESQLCAGAGEDDEKEKDTCQGDSGGPLQIYHLESDVTCMYDVVGVTSFGKACGIGKIPGVYTKVSNYIKWIEDIVWP